MMTKGILAVTVILGIAGVATAAEQDARVFELRTYYAPEGRLDDLQARFRDHTLKLFEKHGFTNVGYWVPIDNPENKLVYLLAFPNREAQEASWKAFFADPDWQDVRKKTEAKARSSPRWNPCYWARPTIRRPSSPRSRASGSSSCGRTPRRRATWET